MNMFLQKKAFKRQCNKENQVLTLERLRESANKCFAKYNYNYFIFQPPICQNCKHNPQGEAGRI